MGPQLSGSMGLPETFDELAAKDFTEDVFGEKEAGISGVHPMRVIAGETTCSHHAMNMRVMLQLLIPGVEDAEEADLGAEVPGI